MSEKDFEWPPPAGDELSIHEIHADTARAAPSLSPVPLVEDVLASPPPLLSRRSLAWPAALAAVGLIASAGWLLSGRESRMPSAEAGYQRPAAPTIAVSPAAPDGGADTAPPRLTIRATYPLDPPPAVAPVVGALDPAPPALRGTSTLDAPRPPHDMPDAPSPAAAPPAVPGLGVPSATAVIGADASVPVPSPVAALAPATLIRAVLDRYADAYDRRDVASAAALWPSLDQRALARAFASLERQDVDFERCAIDVDGARGSAVCVGTVRYVPTIGRGAEKSGRITWTFDLARSGDGWRIARLQAR